MRISSFLFALCLLLPDLRAEEAKPPAAPQSLAEQLLETMGVQDVGLAAANAALQPSLDQLRTQGVPEEGIQEIAGAADRFYRKCLVGPEFHRALIELYEKHYTQEELKILLDFYRSPVGRKSVKLIPKLMSEAGLIGQELVQKNMGDFQTEIGAIIKKYLKPKATPKAAN